MKPKCPKCGCKRWRHVGEIASINSKTYKRTVIQVVIECMKCGEVYVKKS